ncbi:Phosphoethanolamine N-methyltransferase [Nymphon striatum]|nr:Phosphoethanolamine N-methyltransferase [Nymphon striatum]
MMMMGSSCIIGSSTYLSTSISIMPPKKEPSFGRGGRQEDPIILIHLHLLIHLLIYLIHLLIMSHMFKKRAKNNTSNLSIAEEELMLEFIRDNPYGYANVWQRLTDNCIYWLHMARPSYRCMQLPEEKKLHQIPNTDLHQTPTTLKKLLYKSTRCMVLLSKTLPKPLYKTIYFTDTFKLRHLASSTMNVSQEFLDNEQYTKRSITRYEKIYGEGSVSTGGMHSASECIKILNLKKGETVLDVGAGIGGQAFHMAKNYQVHVTGIDFSYNMLDIAKERLEQQPEEVKRLAVFQRVDMNVEELPEGKFDVVHCRDVMMHISSKKLWIEKFLHTLRPGGRVIVSDYFRGHGQNSEEFEKYVQSRKYSLININSFKKLFEETGFIKVRMENRSKEYGEILTNEIKCLEAKKLKYIEEFSREEYYSMLDSWKSKLHRNNIGDHQWGFIYAEKKPE